MPLKLQHITAGHAGIVAEYEVSHSTPGREGTFLCAPLTLSIGREKAVCELHITECTAATPDEAIARMADWLRRLADGMEKRTGTVQLPF
jgi:hypothetical protein